MNVNLIGGAQGAQNTAPAGTANAADAALFQNLIATALLQKGGTALSATQGADNAGETEGVDISLLMNLLLGGVFSETGVIGDSEEIIGESLLAVVAGTPAEELIAASGALSGTEAAELLAGAGAVLDALSAAGAKISAAVAADAAANSAAVETLIANGEAANTPLVADLADAMRSFAADAEIGRLTAESAELAKVVHIETSRARVLSQSALPLDEVEISGSDANKTADQAASGDVQAANVFVNGAAPAENAAVASGAAYDAVSAVTQDAVATSAVETGARTQTGNTVVSSPAPYSQIANELFAAMANKNVPTVLSMQLEPAELGKIDVSLKLTSAGKLVIDIAAESAKTQALLAGQTDKLVQALGLQNVQVESVSTAGQTLFAGHQSAWSYVDRSMAFFMDLAGNGAGSDKADQSDTGTHLQSGQVTAGIPEEGISEQVARYARRLDLTA